MGLLQTASFRGVPFKVVASAVKKGRKIAIHDYPFRDGGWAEDMGRAMRAYSFTGYLIGDIAPALQLALDNAVEASGPGLLIHPTIGAQMVSVLSAATSVRRDAMRVIEVAFEFIEQGTQSLVTTLIATAVEVIAAADLCLPAAGASLGESAGAAATAGDAPIGEGVAVTTAFAATCVTGGNDPAAVVNLAAGLQPTDANASLGRYANGNASAAPAAGTTIAALQATVTQQRAAIASAATTAIAGATTFATASAASVAVSIAAMIEAMRATMTDPADQIRVLLNIATFSYADSAGGTGLSGDMAAVRNAFAATCRRLAVVSLARGSSVYQPVSYQDAQTLMGLVTAALDVEITAAGDAGLDDIYTALRALRAAVVTDLTTRGATLPQVITKTFAAPLPSLVVSQILYRDASRADQVVQEASPRHPAFLPATMQVLAA